MVLRKLSASSELKEFKLAVGNFLPRDDFLKRVRRSSSFEYEALSKTILSAKDREMSFAQSCVEWLADRLETGIAYADDEMRTWDDFENAFGRPEPSLKETPSQGYEQECDGYIIC